MAACDGGGGSGAPSAAPTASPGATTAQPSAEPSATAEASAQPSAEPSAEPETTASADGTAPPSPTAGKTAAPATSGSAAASKFDCGGKGQKACPMQGWMKGVMARAMASGDNEKLAKALDTVASKPVSGFSQWSAIAADGAAKARAGNIDGAKASCKKCHALYQKKYQTEMRDRPW